MLGQLFFRSDALTRQHSAPLIHERGQYLAHCAAQGMSRSTLCAKARLLVSIARNLGLGQPRFAVSAQHETIARQPALSFQLMFFSFHPLGASNAIGKAGTTIRYSYLHCSARNRQKGCSQCLPYPSS